MLTNLRNIKSQHKKVQVHNLDLINVNSNATGKTQPEIEQRPKTHRPFDRKCYSLIMDMQMKVKSHMSEPPWR